MMFSIGEKKDIVWMEAYVALKRALMPPQFRNSHLWSLTFLVQEMQVHVFQKDFQISVNPTTEKFSTLPQSI